VVAAFTDSKIWPVTRRDEHSSSVVVNGFARVVEVDGGLVRVEGLFDYFGYRVSLAKADNRIDTVGLAEELSA
jgi:hypothetical protein